MLADNLSVVLPVAAMLLAGIGWLVRRRVTRQADVEDNASLERAVNLHKLLREEGMTLEEAKELREQFRSSKGGFTGVEASAIAAKVAEAEKREDERVLLEGDKELTELNGEIRFEDTTVGMGIRAQAELEVVEESLSFAVQQFSEECSAARQASLIEAQIAWAEFRDKDSSLASLMFEGGSAASILYIRHKIELTEQRIKDIRLMQAESNL